MAEAYNPSPEARDGMRRSFAESFMSGENPVDMAAKMGAGAARVDFNGRISREQAEAVMAFVVSVFVRDMVEAIRDHIAQK